MARNSLVGWAEAVRDFVLAHEFAHLTVDAPFGADTDSRRSVAASTTLGENGNENENWNVNTDDRTAIGHETEGGDRLEALFRAGRAIGPRGPPTVRALLDARLEHEVGRAHAGIRATLSRDRRASIATMADYHAAERETVAIRNAAKYLALPYDPPIEAGARTALEGPLPAYVEWVSSRIADAAR